MLFAHYVLDYPLQGEFLAQTKGKYWHSLLSHTMIYALGMAICFKIIGVFTLWKVFVLLFTHYIIDYKKATAKNKDKALTTYLYIDQSLHIGINLILLLF
jgi:hypothetical protein